jgi:hypothetical protein
VYTGCAGFGDHEATTASGLVATMVEVPLAEQSRRELHTARFVALASLGVALLALAAAIITLAGDGGEDAQSSSVEVREALPASNVLPASTVTPVPALLGTWRPQRDSGGMSKIVVAHAGGITTVHAWGALDLGTRRATVYARTAYPVAKQAKGTAFTATFVFDSITDFVTGVLTADVLGRRFLTVSTWTQFGPGEPGSNRANYHTTERFVRVN